jgi:hypothetical protein
MTYTGRRALDLNRVVIPWWSQARLESHPLAARRAQITRYSRVLPRQAKVNEPRLPGARKEYYWFAMEGAWWDIGSIKMAQLLHVQISGDLKAQAM